MNSRLPKVLLDRGADFEAKTIDSLTPLHRAAALGAIEIAEVSQIFSDPTYNCSMTQVLVGFGASKSVMDKEGRTPYDIICEEEHTTCSASERAELESLLSPSTKSA